MKFEHFEDLVKNQTLYFIPIAMLQTLPEPEGDKNEGVETEVTRKVKDQITERNLAITRSIAIEVTYPPNFTWDGYAERLKASEKELDNFVYICYFHINEHENSEMWGRSKHNIAIKSTYGQLIKSLQPKGYVGIDLVNYVQEKTLVPPNHGLDRFLNKRKKYKHEQELRIIADYRFRKNIECVDKSHLGVNLEFINEVVTNDDKVILRIENLLKENNLNVNIAMSTLL